MPPKGGTPNFGCELEMALAGNDGLKEMKISSKLVAAFLFAVFSALCCFAQTSPKFIYQKKIEYEVTSSGPMYITYSDGCVGMQFVSVYVDPKSATEAKIRKFAAEISSTFPVEYDLMIMFSIDRTDDYLRDDDDIFLRKLRGTYGRKAGIASLIVFPNGTTEAEFDEAMATNDKDN